MATPAATAAAAGARCLPRAARRALSSKPKWRSAQPAASPGAGDLELFGAYPCPFVQRVEIAARLKGADLTHTAVGLESKPSWFETKSPAGLVPLLRHKERYVYESAVIVQYLDDLRPEAPALMYRDDARPEDAAFFRAQQRIYTHFLNVSVSDAVWQLLFARTPGRAEGVQLSFDEALENLETRMEELDAAVASVDPGRGPFLVGDRPGFFEVMAYPFMQRLGMVDAFHNTSTGCQFYPNLAAMVERLEADPAFAETSPPLDDLVEAYRPFVEGRKPLQTRWKH